MIARAQMHAREPSTSLPRREWVALAALVAAVLSFEALWLARDPLPDLTNDDEPLARLAFAWAQHWTHGLDVQPERLTSTPYPPLPSLVGAVGILLRPDQPIMGMLQAHGAYIALLVAGTWTALRRDLGAPTAFAAALLAPSYAWWGGRGQMHVDVHLGACLVALLGAWRWSDGLQRVGWSFAAGLAIAAGLLTKFSFVFFAGVPAAWMVAEALASWTEHRGARVAVRVSSLVAAGCIVATAAGRLAPIVAGIASVGALAGIGIAWRMKRAPDAVRTLLGVLAFVGGASLAAPWYLSNLARLRGFLDANLAHAFAGAVLPVEQVAWVYPSVLARAVLDTPVCIAVLLCTVVALRRALRTDARTSVVWLAWAMILVGGLALTLQPYRTPRYIFPAAAPAMVVAAWSAAALERWRTQAAALVGVWAAWLWCSAPWVLAHPDPAARADWWARVVLVPPNSEETLAQLRAQALSKRPNLRSTLPGPSPSPFRFAEAARASADRVDLPRVRTLAAEGFPEEACGTLALAMIARGASPYLRCGGPGAEVRVVADPSPPRPGELDGGGPYDRTRVHVRYAARLARP